MDSPPSRDKLLIYNNILYFNDIFLFIIHIDILSGFLLFCQYKYYIYNILFNFYLD